MGQKELSSGSKELSLKSYNDNVKNKHTKKIAHSITKNAFRHNTRALIGLLHTDIIQHRLFTHEPKNLSLVESVHTVPGLKLGIWCVGWASAGRGLMQDKWDSYSFVSHMQQSTATISVVLSLMIHILRWIWSIGKTTERITQASQRSPQFSEAMNVLWKLTLNIKIHCAHTGEDSFSLL